MKRSTVVSLAALVLALSAAVALAQAGGTSPTPSTTPAASMSKPTQAMSHRGRTPAKHLINLNSATKEELMKLPGVDDGLADKIIAARPLKSKGELVSKKVVTQAEFKKINGLVFAKQI